MGPMPVYRISDKLQLIMSNAVLQILRICTTFIMLRKIGPAENGEYYLIVYAAGFLISLGNFAIPQTLVQLRNLPERVIFDTALVLETGIFTIYALFTIGCSIVLAHTHASSQMWELGIIIGVTNIFTGLYDVQSASLNRHMQFRAESWQNVIFALSTSITGITFAYLGWGVFAIAFQLLVGQLMANVAINIRVPLKWPRYASWTVAKQYLKAGSPISASLYVSTIEGSIVGLVINSFAGETGVGLWGKTVQIQQLFAENIMKAFTRVAYPVLCGAVGDIERLKMLFLRMSRILTLAGLVFTVIVAINSDDMVRIFMASKWLAASPLLAVTAWAIPAGALFTVGYMMCLALKRANTIFRASAWNLVLFIPIVFIARPTGLLGLAFCWAISRYFIAFSVLRDPARQIGVNLRNVFRQMLPLLAAAALSSILMILARRYVFEHSQELVRLTCVCCIGTAVFALVAWLVDRETIVDVYRLAHSPRDGGTASTSPAASTEELMPVAAVPAVDSASAVLVSSGSQGETPITGFHDKPENPKGPPGSKMP